MDDHLRVSDHALDRYIERVKPTMTRTEALRDLRRLARTIGQVSIERPDWIAPACRVDAWLLLGDDVVLPVLRSGAGWMAKTTLARGVLPPGVRRARNRAHAARRRLRSLKARSGGKRHVIEEAA